MVHQLSKAMFLSIILVNFSSERYNKGYWHNRIFKIHILSVYLLRNVSESEYDPW